MLTTYCCCLVSVIIWIFNSSAKNLTTNLLAFTTFAHKRVARVKQKEIKFHQCKWPTLRLWQLLTDGPKRWLVYMRKLLLIVAQLRQRHGQGQGLATGTVTVTTIALALTVRLGAPTRRSGSTQNYGHNNKGTINTYTFVVKQSRRFYTLTKYANGCKLLKRF